VGDVGLLLATGSCDGGDSASALLALAWLETGLGAVVAAGASALKKGMLLLWYALCVFGHESKDRARHA
jgi:hypothetical protein